MRTTRKQAAIRGVILGGLALTGGVFAAVITGNPLPTAPPPVSPECQLAARVVRYFYDAQPTPGAASDAMFNRELLAAHWASSAQQAASEAVEYQLAPPGALLNTSASPVDPAGIGYLGRERAVAALQRACRAR